jgi:hypothetical protein
MLARYVLQRKFEEDDRAYRVASRGAGAAVAEAFPPSNSGAAGSLDLGKRRKRRSFK